MMDKKKKLSDYMDELEKVERIIYEAELKKIEINEKIRKEMMNG